MNFFNRCFGAQNGANGVHFGYVQPDAATKIGRGDPEKISEIAKSSPLLGFPSPLYIAAGTGRDGGRPGAVPVPWLLYIVYVQTGAEPSHPKSHVSGEKIWDVTWHRLVESPKCSGPPSAQGGIFQVGGHIFQG